MATAASENEPSAATFHEHRRFPWVDGSEVELCLVAESSTDINVRPHMLVLLNLSFRVKFAIPSPLEGGCYHLGGPVPPIIHCRLLCEDPSSHFATLDASRETMEPMVAPGRPPQDEILRLLLPDISRVAHATVKNAEARGHTAMKVVAVATVAQRVESDVVDAIVDHLRQQQLGALEEESMGTCAVCLEEVKKEWIWPVTLACSHVFHLGCISAWLQRSNSCPLCRSRQPIDPADAF